jgi:mannosyltransferase
MTQHPHIRAADQGAPVRPAFWLALCVAVALALSLAFFMGQSLRLDEAQSLWQTSRSLPAIWRTIAGDVHVPLYHTLLYGWRLVFGSSVEAARAFSLALFLAAIPALYRLGRLMYGPRAALFAAAIFALSPFMNWYGSEARMYSLLVLVTLCHQYWFVRAWKAPEPGTWRRLALWSVLGVYTHYFFWLVLAADAAFFFANRRLFPPGATRKLLVSGAAIVVAFLPWLALVASTGGPASTQPNLSAPGSTALFNTFSQFVFGFQTDALNTALVSLWPVTVLLAFLALRRTGRVTPETLYLIGSLAIPNLLAFGVSVWLAPIYLTRYLIFTLPVMYLIVAWLLVEAYPSTLSRYLRGGLVAAMAATLATQALSPQTPVKENYREASALLEEVAGPADVIAVSAPFTIYPILYYYGGPAAITTLPYWDRSQTGPIPAYAEERLPEEVERIRGGAYRNLWVLQSYDQGYEEDLRIYLDTHLERFFARELSPGLTLYGYRLRYDDPAATNAN